MKRKKNTIKIILFDIFLCCYKNQPHCEIQKIQTEKHREKKVILFEQ